MGLKRLGDLPLEFHRQEPVLEYRAAYLDVLSEVEALAEGAGRNAMVQDLTALLLLRDPVARDEQHALLVDKFDLLGREPRKRHCDAVVVLAKPLDVVGRPVWGGLSAL
jgi:hypothetical protein